MSYRQWRLTEFRRELEPWNFDPFDDTKAAWSFRAARYLLEEVDRLEAENRQLRAKPLELLEKNSELIEKHAGLIAEAWDEGFQACAGREHAVEIDPTGPVPDCSVVFGEAPSNPYRGWGE